MAVLQAVLVSLQFNPETQLFLPRHAFQVWGVFQLNKENDNYYKNAKDGKTFNKEVFADMLDDKAAGNIVEALKKHPDVPAEFHDNLAKFFDGVWSPHESTQPVVGMCYSRGEALCQTILLSVRSSMMAEGCFEHVVAVCYSSRRVGPCTNSYSPIGRRCG